MKSIKIALFLAVLSTGAYAQKMTSFGKKISAKNAEPTTVLTTNPSVTKVVGEVESVCQVKGCWMKLKLDNGETMRVTFKDYGFFVPKDIAGQKVIVEGVAKTKTTSVAELQHYAEDAGKTKEEIAKITEPKTELTFVADGVLVPKK